MNYIEKEIGDQVILVPEELDTKEKKQRKSWSQRQKEFKEKYPIGRISYKQNWR